jgi:hypothetical protein
MSRPSRVVGGMELITATTTIMAGITVGTTPDIGMRAVGRTTDNPVGQISARLRASRLLLRLAHPELTAAHHYGAEELDNHTPASARIRLPR